MPETIQPASIEQETRRRYLNYALSVITSRALPDVRDGLKPVQRRILYTMYHDLHLHAEGRPRKCAKIVGDVTGNYHPHGTAPAYEALVRLAQDFAMRVLLVDGQGNFGSVDGDAPAAERYTEAKLAPLAEPLMAELRQHTVDMRPNYDGTREEPVVVPAQFPNLLVNGATGIAVGMATNIPPHNLGEVVKAAVHLIDDPDASTAQLLDRVKGPDFPLGGKVVTDRPTLRKIYEEGSGSIKVQGEWKVEEVGKRKQIVITSIPYGVNKGNLESAIGEIIAARKLPQLLNLANESNAKEGIRIALEMKADADPDVVMAYLYKHTALQENFAYNLTCLVPTSDGTPQPQRLGLKAILRHFLDFRFDTVRRRFTYELEQLRRRIHILEGFRIVFDALDKAIRLIRDSDGKQDAAGKLMKTFKLDEVQADAILDAQLYRLAQLEIKKILDELKDKEAEATRIEAILRSDKKLWGVVKDELNQVGEKYADRRRTRMASAEDLPDFDPEAYIVRENTNVVLTRDGWVKRVGRLAAVESTRVREGDEVIAVVPGSTLDHVVFFADDGAAYTMRINEVPASSGYGEPVAKFFRLGDQVRLINAATTDERFTPPDEPAKKNGEPGGPYLLVVTAQGQTLRTPLTPFRTASNKLGRRYVRLNEGDRVVMATVLRDEETIYLASASGHVIHFRIDDINVLSGAGKGVMGIKLEGGDICLGGALMSGRFDKMVLETSGGKTMEFGRAKYDVTSRGGKGFEAVKRTNFVRVVPPPIELVDWDQVEGKGDDKAESPGTNGEQRKLFD
ncbi:MAG TPA: DNA topoisomerase IV subunit A [Gemmataceae bacterium]|jgi:DNA gyrase subunit A|nr:DNA topoisomerase IV subunit A [Gemmataceae bacterium]